MTATFQPSSESPATAAAWLIGLPAGIGAAPVASIKKPPLTSKELFSQGLLDAVTDHRVLRSHKTPEAILEHFHDAPTGTLMFYYQLFWPIYITGQQLEKLEHLKAVCAKARKKRWQRVRALPAVAAAHALGSATDEVAEVLRNLIHFTLDVEHEPNRGVIAIIWQSLTSALIRNHSHWQRLRLDSRFIAQAEAVCHSFLAGDTLLLDVATYAWQFLLTYERALLDRGDRETLGAIQLAHQRVAQRNGPGFA